MFAVIGVILLVGIIGATAPLHAQPTIVQTTVLPAHTLKQDSPTWENTVPVQPIEPSKPVTIAPVSAVEADDSEEANEPVHYGQVIDHPRIQEVSEKTEKVYRFYPLKGQTKAADAVVSADTDGVK